MTLQSIFVILLAVSVLLAMILAFYAWLRREVAGATPFMFMMAGVMVWGMAYIMEILSSPLEAKIFWDNIQLSGADILITAIFVFVLVYIGSARKLRRFGFLLLVEPVLALTLVWTAPWHGWLRQNAALGMTGEFPLLTYDYGPVLWGRSAYHLTLVIVSIVLLVFQFRRMHYIYRRQLSVLLLGLIIPFAGTLLSLIGWIPVPLTSHLDITPLTMLLASSLWAIGLFHFRILDIMPAARQVVFDEMQDILIVVDSNRRVVDLNLAAHALLAFPVGMIIGEKLHTFLPQLSGYLQENRVNGEVAEVSLRNNGSEFVFSVRSTSLYDHRDLLGGWLLILRDITDEKRMDEQVRMSREIADTLRQIGGVLSSTLDFDSLMDRLLELVEQVIPYDTGSVLLIEDHQVQVKRTRGYDRYDAEVQQAIHGLRFDLDQFTNVHRMHVQQQAQVIPDTRTAADWIEPDIPVKVLSWVGAPILFQGRVRGFFSLEKEKPGYFTDSHADILATFASQAALAMENARLYTEMRIDLAREQRLNEAMRSINRTMDTETILKEILALCIELLQVERADLGLIAPDGRYLRYHTLRENSGVVEKSQEFSLQEDPFHRWMMDMAGPVIANLQDFGSRFPAELLKNDISSVIGIPVMIGNSRLGVLGLYHTHGKKRFTERDLALAESIGHQAGIAIQNSRLFKDVQRMAITDPLTGWYNRRYFFTQAQNELDRTLRYGHALSMIMLDIDRFKLVNDTYGHLMGDHVLQAIARRIEKSLRKPDIYARLGGEEFVILLPETGALSAQQAAERIRLTIADQPIATAKGPILITISLGVASIHGEQISEVEKLLDMADQALYAAKSAGRNRVGVWRVSGIHEILSISVA